MLKQTASHILNTSAERFIFHQYLQGCIFQLLVSGSTTQLRTMFSVTIATLIYSVQGPSVVKFLVMGAKDNNCSVLLLPLTFKLFCKTDH